MRKKRNTATTFPQHLKFDPQKSPIWERLEMERAMFDERNWLLTMALKNTYKETINILSFGMYYLEYFYKFRYIEDACKIYPSIKEETKDASLKGVMDYIKEKLNYDYENSESDEQPLSTYDIYRRTQKRKLTDMLNALIGKDSALSLLKDEDERFKFGILEFRFFTFLLDTYKHQNGKLLRKKKYTEITYDYYLCLKDGLELLCKMHPMLGKSADIINKWQYDVKLSKEHLSREIVKFKDTLDKAVDFAYQSEASKLNLDYLADVISQVTKALEHKFGL